MTSSTHNNNNTSNISKNTSCNDNKHRIYYESSSSSGGGGGSPFSMRSDHNDDVDDDTDAQRLRTTQKTIRMSTPIDRETLSCGDANKYTFDNNNNNDDDVSSFSSSSFSVPNEDDDNDDNDDNDALLRTPLTTAAAAAHAPSPLLNRMSIDNHDNDNDDKINNNDWKVMESTKTTSSSMSMGMSHMASIHLLKLQVGHLTALNRSLTGNIAALEREKKNLMMNDNFYRYRDDVAALQVLRGDELDRAVRENDKLKLQMQEMLRERDRYRLSCEAGQVEVRRLMGMLATRSAVESDAARRLQELTISSLRTEENLVQRGVVAEAKLEEVRARLEDAESRCRDEMEENVRIKSDVKKSTEESERFKKMLEVNQKRLKNVEIDRDALRKEIGDIKARDSSLQRMDNDFAVEMNRLQEELELERAKSLHQLSSSNEREKESQQEICLAKKTEEMAKEENQLLKSTMSRLVHTLDNLEAAEEYGNIVETKDIVKSIISSDVLHLLRSTKSSHPNDPNKNNDEEAHFSETCVAACQTDQIEENVITFDDQESVDCCLDNDSSTEVYGADEARHIRESLLASNSKLEAMMRESEQNISHLKRENEELRNKCSALKTLSLRHNETWGRGQVNKEQTQNEITKLTQENMVLEQAKRSLEDENMRIVERRILLEGEIQETRHDLDKIKQQLKYIENKLQLQQQKNNRANAEILQLRDRLNDCEQENRELLSEMNGKNEEINAVTIIRDNALSEGDKLRNLLATRDVELSSLRDMINDIEVTKAEILTKLKVSDNKLKHGEAERSRLQQELKLIVEDREKVSLEYCNLKSQYEMKDEEITSLLKQQEKARLALISAQNRYNFQKEVIENNDNEKSKVNEELHGVEDKLKCALDENERIKCEFQRQISDTEDQLASKIIEISSLQKKIEELHAQMISASNRLLHNKEIESQKNVLLDSLKSAQNELREIKNSNTRNNEMVNQLGRENRQLVTDMDIATNEVNDLKRESSQLSDELSQVKHQYASKVKDNERFMKEGKDLKQEVMLLRNAMKDIERASQSKTIDGVTMRSHGPVKDHNRRELEQQTFFIKAQLESKNDEVLQLQKQIEELSAQLISISNQLLQKKDIESEKDELLDSLKSAQNELREIENSNTRNNEMVNQLERENRQLVTDMKTATNEVNDLKRESSQLSDELSQVKQRYASKVKDNERFMKESKDLKQEVMLLRNAMKDIERASQSKTIDGVTTRSHGPVKDHNRRELEQQTLVIKAQLESKNDEVLQLRKQIEELSAQLISAFDQPLQKSDDNIDVCRLIKIESEEDVLLDSLKSAQNELREVQNGPNQSEGLANRLERENRQLVTDMKTATNEVNDLKRESIQLSDELSQVKQRCASKVKDNESFMKENEELKQEVKLWNAMKDIERASQSKTIDGVTTRSHGSVKGRLMKSYENNSLTRVTTIKKHNILMENELTCLREKIEELENEKLSLHSHLENANNVNRNNVDKLCSKIKLIDKAKQELHDETTHLKQQVNSLETDKSQLLDDTRHLKSQIDLLQKEKISMIGSESSPNTSEYRYVNNSSLENDFTELKARCSQLEQNENSVRMEKEELQARVNGLLEECRLLVRQDHERFSSNSSSNEGISVEEKNDEIMPKYQFHSKEDLSSLYKMYMEEKFLRLRLCSEKATLIAAHEAQRSALVSHHEATINVLFQKLKVQKKVSTLTFQNN